MRTLLLIAGRSGLPLFVRLSIGIAFGSFVFCSSAHPDWNQHGIYHLSPSLQRIEGFEMPRNDLTLYRGIEGSQASLGQVVRAMLGDRLANVESAMFFTVKSGLMKRPQTLLESLVPPRGRPLRERYSEMRFQSAIDSEIARNGGRALDEPGAIENAYKILARAYSDSYTTASVIDYNSSDRDDFPPGFLYSSVYVEVAKIYGPNILIFNEKKNKRSLDQNYWNWVKNRKWVGTLSHPFPDRGEFLTPFLIPFDQIVGFQWSRRSFDKSTPWHIWRSLNSDLGLVLMKSETEEGPLVLAFDGTGLSHIVEVGTEFCSAQSQFAPKEAFPSLATPDCSIKPKLISVFRLCQATSVDCRPPENLWLTYQKSKLFTETLGALLKSLKNTSIDGKQIYLCSASNTPCSP